MKVTVGSYKLGNQEWKKVDGKWFVMMWGWWPGGGGPSWRWVEVSDDRVPRELKIRKST